MKERNNLERFNEEIIPFEWKNWDEQDLLVNTYYDVVFFADFGRIKSGDKFDSILVDYGRGLVEAYDSEKDEVIVRQYFKAYPCESENNLP